MTESYLEYPARLNISYQDAQNRWSIWLRLLIFLPLIPAVSTALNFILNIVGIIILIAGILAALYIIFSATYPRWLFEFHENLLLLQFRILAYILLLTDEFPSIHGSEKFQIELTYPNAETDLNRLLPLIK